MSQIIGKKNLPLEGVSDKNKWVIFNNLGIYMIKPSMTNKHFPSYHPIVSCRHNLSLCVCVCVHAWVRVCEYGEDVGYSIRNTVLEFLKLSVFWVWAWKYFLYKFLELFTVSPLVSVFKSHFKLLWSCSDVVLSYTFAFPDICCY
jgi:hypothetical protein